MDWSGTTTSASIIYTPVYTKKTVLPRTCRRQHGTWLSSNQTKTRWNDITRHWRQNLWHKDTQMHAWNMHRKLTILKISTKWRVPFLPTHLSWVSKYLRLNLQCIMKVKRYRLVKETNPYPFHTYYRKYFLFFLTTTKTTIIITLYTKPK